MRGKAEHAAKRDEPFRRVILIPLDGIPVIHRELVVEVVVTLADGHKRSDEMIARSVVVIKRRLAKVMSKRVDTERAVVDEAQARCASIDIATAPIAPQEPRNESGDAEAHAEDEPDVPAVLPPDNVALAEITDVGDTRLAAWLDNHPADMRPPETLVGVVRIKFGVGVPMVGAVAPRPPLDGALHGASTCGGKEVLQRLGRVV